jgi:hypothetical protein
MHAWQRIRDRMIIYKYFLNKMLTNQLIQVDQSQNLKELYDSDVATIAIDGNEIRTKMLTSKCAFAMHCGILHQFICIDYPINIDAIDKKSATNQVVKQLPYVPRRPTPIGNPNNFLDNDTIGESSKPVLCNLLVL